MKIRDKFRGRLVQIILIVIIPIVTIGFNSIETAPFYQKIIGVYNIDDTVNQELLGLTFSGTTQNHMMFSSTPQFQEIWSLINKNTNISFPKNEIPQFIGILSPHAADYADIWNGSTSTTKLLLIPDSVPVLVGFCQIGGTPSCQQNQNAFIVGSAQDIEDWAQKKQDFYRTLIDSLIAMLSVITGILLLIFE